MEDALMWHCPVCKYKTFSQNKRRQHLQNMKFDPVHFGISDNNNRSINSMLQERSEMKEYSGALICYRERRKDKRLPN